ncbi:MAG: lipoprotein signal peptidase [Candidatus Symbiothrix sp.]|jgi:signal peptidase II|nr:lipoprotein signal peptidase [Candidatus Symbiothrix sp.]
MKNKGVWATIIVLFLLLLDQVIKIWVKTHLALFEDIVFTDWFIIRFVENPGIAMGIEIMNKVFVTIFRIVASGVVIYYLAQLVKRNFSWGYIICVALVLAGAMGNCIDCVFYGVIFSESTPTQVATLFPPEGGYTSWFNGKVVDMFYFPFFEWRGFVFFRYIFNLADAAISVGIVAILIFYRDSLAKSFEKKITDAEK